MFPDYIPEERMHEYPQLAQRGVTIPDYAPDIEPVEPQTEVVPVEEVGDAPRRGRPRKVITDGSDTG